MTETQVAAVRLKLNFDPDDGNLSDDVIQAAIDDAVVYISNRATTSNQDLIDLAVKNRAAYLAYQAYSDMINHEPEGSFIDGKWTPTQDVKVRDTASKLAALKADADETLALVAPAKVSVMPFCGVVKLGG